MAGTADLERSVGDRCSRDVGLARRAGQRRELAFVRRHEVGVGQDRMRQPRGRSGVEDRQRAGRTRPAQRFVCRGRRDLVPDQDDVAFADREGVKRIPHGLRRHRPVRA